MILHTGLRTDIPAFYTEWFRNRLKEGYVMVRNPYNPVQVTKYQISPDVVDVISFCTKNPAPFLPYMDLLKDYGQYWFVTITPYGKEIEPNVPDKESVMESFKTLAKEFVRIGNKYGMVIKSCAEGTELEEYGVDCSG